MGAMRNVGPFKMLVEMPEEEVPRVCEGDTEIDLKKIGWENVACSPMAGFL
jgi:hypothetical protein